MAMYLTIGRVILRVLVGNQTNNAILQIFEIATNPFYALVRKLTFGKVNGLALPIVVIIFLLATRIALSLFFRMILQ